MLLSKPIIRYYVYKKKRKLYSCHHLSIFFFFAINYIYIFMYIYIINVLYPIRIRIYKYLYLSITYNNKYMLFICCICTIFYKFCLITLFIIMLKWLYANYKNIQ